VTRRAKRRNGDGTAGARRIRALSDAAPHRERLPDYPHLWRAVHARAAKPPSI